MPSDSTGQPSQSGQPRPRQVTMAVALIVGGSVLGVLFTFQRVAGLGSLDVQEGYAELVSQPPLAGAGITADGFSEFIRVASLVAGGAATAAAILGVYVLQRSRSARIGLSILAPILFLGGLVVSDLLLVLAAVGVLLLWLHPTSDWYAGRPIPAPRARPGLPGGGAPRREADPHLRQYPPVDAPPPAPTPTPSAGAPDGPGPRPTPGFGRAPAAYDVRPGVPTAPGATAPPRPTPVVIACILTWVASGLTLFVLLLSLLAVFAAPDMLLDEALREQPELQDQGVTVGLLQAATGVVAAIVVPWCVFAIVVAVLAVRRVAWARTALLISASVAAALSLVTTLVTLGAGAPALITLAMALGTVTMLLRPEVRAWFRAGRPS